MIPIYVDQTFKYGWHTRTSGLGVVEVNEGILKSYSTVTGDSALLDYYFPIQPGQIIEVEVWAKDNGSSVKPRIAVDSYFTSSDFQLLDYTEVEQSGEWGLYKLIVTVPFNVSRPYARFSLGKWGSMSATDCSYKSPVIKIANGIGVTRTIAMGLIRMENGVPSLHNSFRTIGIKSMEYNASGRYLDVIVDFSMHSVANLRSFPCPFVTTTGDKPIVAQAGNVVSVEGGTRVRLKWSNGTAHVDMSSESTVFTFLKLEI